MMFVILKQFVIMLLLQPNIFGFTHPICKRDQVLRYLRSEPICCNPVQCGINEEPTGCSTQNGNDSCPPCGSGLRNPFRFHTKLLPQSGSGLCKEPEALCNPERPPKTRIINPQECLKTGIPLIECDRVNGYTGDDNNLCHSASVSCYGPGRELTLSDSCEPCKKGFIKLNPASNVCVKNVTLISFGDNIAENISMTHDAAQDSQLWYLGVALPCIFLVGLISFLAYHLYKKLRNRQDINMVNVVQNGNACNGDARNSVAVPVPDPPNENPKRLESGSVFSSLTSTIHSGLKKLSPRNRTVPPEEKNNQPNSHIPDLNKKHEDLLPGQGGPCSYDAKTGAIGLDPRIGATQACPSMQSYAGNTAGTQASSNQPGAGPMSACFQSDSRLDPSMSSTHQNMPGTEQIPRMLPGQQRGQGMQPSQVNTGISSGTSSARQSMQRRQDSGLGTGTDRSSQSSEISKPVARISPARTEQTIVEHSSLNQSANARLSSDFPSSMNFDSILDSRSDAQDQSLTYVKTVYEKGEHPQEEQSLLSGDQQNEDQDPEEDETLLKAV